jgi:2-polyprenyl-3-methyl-5-hydroxy-6-metoxy-1,4-benzoquinol methylase
MVNINQQYYQNNAQRFYESTIDVDMQSLYQYFLPLVKNKGRILDAGCGTGRDSKKFIDLGFEVEAFDASEKLATLASSLINQTVRVDFFETYDNDKSFDAIWACASLLHVPHKDLASVFKSLTALLNTQGIFYCSFKYGDQQIERNGRLFTNLTEETFAQQIADLPLEITKQWKTGDLREGRESEKWLNVIMRKTV